MGDKWRGCLEYEMTIRVKGKVGIRVRRMKDNKWRGCLEYEMTIRVKGKVGFRVRRMKDIQSTRPGIDEVWHYGYDNDKIQKVRDH
eukprot:1392778-Amorphochlora_amoeboformis.AAC.1